MIAAFRNHKRYPIKTIRGKLVIRTEYGDFLINETETTCHHCGKQLGYVVSKDEVPGFEEIYNDKNFFVPYFWTLHGDCIAGLHCGFTRPAHKLESIDRQTLIEEWCR